jgi:hypothetical protein
LDEIAELRDGLDRPHTAPDDLVVRGGLAAGPQDLVDRMSGLGDEFRAAGAEHLTGRLAAPPPRRWPKPPGPPER